MVQVEEYPTINFDVKMNGKNRNKPCPCGSGKNSKIVVENIETLLFV